MFACICVIMQDKLIALCLLSLVKAHHLHLVCAWMTVLFLAQKHEFARYQIAKSSKTTRKQQGPIVWSASSDESKQPLIPAVFCLKRRFLRLFILDFYPFCSSFLFKKVTFPIKFGSLDATFSSAGLISPISFL